MIRRPLGFIIVLCLLAGCASTARSTEPPAIGAAAPNFTLPALDGSTVDLAALHGSVVVVNFWATWCGPCVEETPRLVEWHEQYKPKGLQMVGVNALVRDSRDLVEEFAQQYGITYPIALDSEGHIVAQWLAQQMPRSYVIDRTGVVRFARIGELTQKDFDEQIAPLLAQ